MSYRPKYKTPVIHVVEYMYK